MDNYAPFNVYAKVNLDDLSGWRDKFCIVCKNYIHSETDMGVEISRPGIKYHQEGSPFPHYIYIIVLVVVFGVGGAACFLKGGNQKDSATVA